MALLIVSAVSSIAIAIVAVVVIYILNTLRENNNKQQALLQFLEKAQELTQQQNQETAKEITQQSESYDILKARIDSLTPCIANLEHRLSDLLESNAVSQENICNGIGANHNALLEKIQALTDKIEAFAVVQNQVESLNTSTTNLENRLLALLETSNTAQSDSSRTQLEKIQALTDKIEAFAVVQNQVESLTTSTTNLENRLLALLETSNTSQSDSSRTQLEKIQALTDKIESFAVVQNQVESLTTSTTNLENRLLVLLETSNTAQGDSTRTQLEKIQELTEKIEAISSVRNPVNNILEIIANLENRLNIVLETNNAYQESITKLLQGNRNELLSDIQSLLAKFETVLLAKNPNQSLAKTSANESNPVEQEDEITAKVDNTEEISIEHLVENPPAVENTEEVVIQSTNNSPKETDDTQNTPVENENENFDKAKVTEVTPAAKTKKTRTTQNQKRGRKKK